MVEYFDFCKRVAREWKEIYNEDIFNIRMLLQKLLHPDQGR